MVNNMHITTSIKKTSNMDQCVEFLINDPNNCIVTPQYHKKYLYDNNISIFGIKNINDLIFSYLLGAEKHQKQYLYDNNISIFGIKNINDLIFSYLFDNDDNYTLTFELPSNFSDKQLVGIIVPNDEPTTHFDYYDFIKSGKILPRYYDFGLKQDLCKNLGQYDNELDNVYL